MEHHKDKLQKALANLPSYEPTEDVWNEIDQKLPELPLQDALKKLPEYEPNAMLWDLIEIKVTSKLGRNWWAYFAAALVLIVGAMGIWFSNANKTTVSYAQQVLDSRLLTDEDQVTDTQYQKLKAYCESETLICNSNNFRQLSLEYETLHQASRQLQQAMGDYNTEPELMHQFNTVEQQKANILNEMAKMI
jgi:hypothetical protein